MTNIHLLSIALEAVIVLVSLGLVIRKKFYPGLGLAITFGIYVYYDLSQFYAWQVNSTILTSFFLLATISALAAVVSIYRKIK